MEQCMMIIEKWMVIIEKWMVIIEKWMMIMARLDGSILFSRHGTWWFGRIAGISSMAAGG